MIDNYDALTLGHYMRVNAVLEGDGDELEKQVQIIAILADMEPDKVLLLPLADYASMAEKTAFLRVPCPVKEIPEDGRFMGLVPTGDFTKINTAQYVDFQGLAKGFPGTLPEILAIFLVPEGHAYNDGYDLAEVQRRVRDIPFPDAMAVAAFFFVRFTESITASLTSLGDAVKATRDPSRRKALETKVREAERLLASVGAG